MFDVGLGDCIYCRIPDAHKDGRDFHILIDCGTLSSSDYLSKAVTQLKKLLPKIDGKLHIDLLVVTHEHKDHMLGFGMDLWAGISFGAIWMNAAMDPKHPQAKKARALHGFAAQAMARALQLNVAMSPQLRELASAVALNKDAMKNLRETFPKRSGIKATYVHAESKKSDLALPIEGTTISVLGPERDIDYYYVGKSDSATLGGSLRLIESGLPEISAAVPAKNELPVPTNVDSSDFAKLRSRMLSAAFAFAALDGVVCNNTSVVLLIEWKGKRLLFVGDAEWNEGFKEKKARKFSWNVMWNLRKKKLNSPVNFLKIGHHGSENSTPWGMTAGSKKGEPVEILNAILPVKSRKQAQAIVSTRRGNYPTIPRSELLVEIGNRVSNTKNYATAFKKADLKTSDVPKFSGYERKFFGEVQPLRTDLETMLSSKGYIDVEIEP